MEMAELLTRLYYEWGWYTTYKMLRFTDTQLTKERMSKNRKDHRSCKLVLGHANRI
jgi:hypothetical protein